MQYQDHGCISHKISQWNSGVVLFVTVVIIQHFICVTEIYL